MYQEGLYRKHVVDTEEGKDFLEVLGLQQNPYEPFLTVEGENETGASNAGNV